MKHEAKSETYYDDEGEISELNSLNIIGVERREANRPKSLRKRFPVQYKKVIKNNIKKLLVLFTICILGAYLGCKNLTYFLSAEDIAHSTYGLIWSASIAIFLLSAIVMLGYETLYYLTYDYSLDSQNLIIEKGVLAVRKIIVPFSRITDVTINQDLLDVVFGLHDIQVSTAAKDSWAFAHIYGLKKSDAETLAALLLKKTNATSPDFN